MQLRIHESLRTDLEAEVAKVVDAQIASRLGAKDDSIWGQDAKVEAAKRLGWIDSPKTSVDLIPEILKLRDHFRDLGVDRIVLCGMGGSSLAPEVIAKNTGHEIVILDSTAPDQVLSAVRELERTAVVVSSKSGATVETDSQKRAFESSFVAAGLDPTKRIVVVTDPGSPLDTASRADGYRVFNADPDVGGRYSALTAFGLVPAGLAGADIASLLASASMVSFGLSEDSTDNPAIWLGVALAATPGIGQSRDKFLIETDGLPGFGDWVEQLVAESTGKQERGILPVVVTGSAPEIQDVPSDTIFIRFSDSIPGVEHMTFSGSLGELFLLWEYATAIAGYLMNINPFDQPDVESAKIAARALLDSPGVEVAAGHVDRGITVSSYGLNLVGSTVEAAVEELLSQVTDHSYIAVQVYLSRPEYPQFEKLRDIIAKRTGRPVTFGWGPRFLHSTGQYHKGGPKQGLFVQITGEHGIDLEIKDRPFSFGELIRAQAAGDAKVLSDNGLPVLSLHMSEPLRDLAFLEKVIAS
ncbi:MAG: glucose-6-phosphate isomerase [Aquiluna sp.]|mgnify:FL=1|jgi:glucose-6-phosphate isomerase|tara:strand:+ start:2143 stop:3720 length:1578 start_codon:yes stop_codon:yes gene_type:complete